MLGRKGKSLLFVYLLIDFIHQFIIEKEWTYFKIEKSIIKEIYGPILISKVV